MKDKNAIENKIEIVTNTNAELQASVERLKKLLDAIVIKEIK